ncbi:MAG: thioredoxin domain-containing protein [Gammaproteobacteria bacterium]|nr:thioredoxin domain-containing protein [Gammaproteobacteria bacterium]
MMKSLFFISLFILHLNAYAGSKAPANRLINESSPYLLQHAYNPVDWYPWGDEAFQKARQQDKPVFISVGYSTCHWCHVMAHESFENPAIAKLLNQHFISIKVDREERPDIDRIYITAAEILAGYGGWPTTIIANNSLQPFFASTYLPPFSKAGHKGLEEILTNVITLWRDQRDKVNQVAAEVTALMRSHLQNQVTQGEVKLSSIDNAYLQFSQNFDNEHGGFSNAPKFPRTAIFDFLLMYGQSKPNNNAHSMVENSLNHILRGGIYDHVGGGFHRYSVDAQWQVPHFEKMLYDQGLIINTLLDAARLMPANHYQRQIRQSLDFVIRQMRHPDGGFYSAYDADSIRPDNPQQHGEGAYYVWKKSELGQLLSQPEQRLFYPHFNIQDTGNVESDPEKEFSGLNILFAEQSLQATAKTLALSLPDAESLIESALNKLLQQRRMRPAPHLDDKIISGWNALVIKALAKASTQLNMPQYRVAAEQAAGFIYRHLYDPKSKQLYRSYRNGKHSGEAYLDDYAYLSNALITLYKNSNDRQWLVWASELTEQQIKAFYDQANHGFFDNSANDKNILIRSKEIYDGSMPSANSISIENLLQLSALMKRPQWKQLATQSLHAFHQKLNDEQENYPQMLRSYLLLLRAH